MEEINVNAQDFKPEHPTPSTNPTGRRSFYFILILSLGLLSVLLLVRLITLGVYYHVSLDELLSTNNQLSSMTEERNLLTKQLQRLQNKTCPAGWRKFCCSCYLLSRSSASWDAARKDCRDRGADLMVIDSPEEQTFLGKITKEHTWIGLNDKEQERHWKWVDGTPLTLTKWEKNQPDNGGGDPKWGEEDCAHYTDSKLWNDRSCSASLQWICEKTP